MKDPLLIHASSFRTYKSIYKKEIKQRKIKLRLCLVNSPEPLSPSKIRQVPNSYELIYLNMVFLCAPVFSIFSSVVRYEPRPRDKAGALELVAEVMKFMINLLKCKMNL